jgi:hypothetical protein
MPGHDEDDDKTLDKVLRDYVKESTSTLATIESTVYETRQHLALHVNDDKHTHDRIYERLNKLEDNVEITGQHNIEELRKKSEGVTIGPKLLDAGIKALGFLLALVVGWLLHHIFWK